MSITLPTRRDALTAVLVAVAGLAATWPAFVLVQLQGPGRLSAPAVIAGVAAYAGSALAVAVLKWAPVSHGLILVTTGAGAVMAIATLLSATNAFTVGLSVGWAVLFAATARRLVTERRRSARVAQAVALTVAELGFATTVLVGGLHLALLALAVLLLAVLALVLCVPGTLPALEPERRNSAWQPRPDVLAVVTHTLLPALLLLLLQPYLVSAQYTAGVATLLVAVARAGRLLRFTWPLRFAAFFVAAFGGVLAVHARPTHVAAVLVVATVASMTAALTRPLPTRPGRRLSAGAVGWGLGMTITEGAAVIAAIALARVLSPHDLGVAMLAAGIPALLRYVRVMVR